MSHLKKNIHSFNAINDTNLKNLNEKTDTSNSHLQNLVNYGGAGNNTTIGDGSVRLQTYLYGNDYAGTMRALKTDTSGRLECSVDALEVTAEQINLNTDNLESKLDSLINYGGAGNNDLGDGNVRLQTYIYGHDGSSNQRRVRVDGDGHLQVDVVSITGGGDATAANQVTNHNKLDTLEATLTNIETDQAALEVLHTSTNSKLDTIDGVLDNAEAHLGNIEGRLPAALTGSGNLKVSIEEGAGGDATAANQVTNHNKLDTLEATLTNIETDQAALEVLHTSTNSKLDTIDGVLDNILIDTSAIKTSAQLLDNAISGNEMQVDIVSSALPSGAATEATLAANEAHIGSIDGKITQGYDVQIASGGSGLQQNLVYGRDSSGNLDALKTDASGHLEVVVDDFVKGQATMANSFPVVISSNQSAVSVSGTVTANLSATDNAVLDDIASKAGDIKTAVEIIDNAISGNEMQVDIVSSALPSGAATAAHQVTNHNKLDTLETTLTNIETDQAALEVLHTSTNSKLDTIDGVLDNILIDTSAIKSAVEIIDNAISGNEMQVDIVSSALPSGAATAAHQVTNHNKLDTLEATLTNIETDQAALEVLHTSTNSKLDTIDGVLDNILIDTSAIKTAVQLLDNAISGSEMQVDVVSGGGRDMELTTSSAKTHATATLTSSDVLTVTNQAVNGITILCESNTLGSDFTLNNVKIASTSGGTYYALDALNQVEETNTVNAKIIHIKNVNCRFIKVEMTQSTGSSRDVTYTVTV